MWCTLLPLKCPWKQEIHTGTSAKSKYSHVHGNRFADPKILLTYYFCIHLICIYLHLKVTVTDPSKNWYDQNKISLVVTTHTCTHTCTHTHAQKVIQIASMFIGCIRTIVQWSAMAHLQFEPQTDTCQMSCEAHTFLDPIAFSSMNLCSHVKMSLHILDSKLTIIGHKAVYFIVSPWWEPPLDIREHALCIKNTDWRCMRGLPIIS